MVVKELERLQKYLARSGVASRRAAEDLIRRGIVKVNGIVVTEMGTQIEPEQDMITVNGQVVQPEKRKIYLLFNKPLRVVTTLDDPQGRAKVTDFLPGIKERVFPVGRLDYFTEGLLLLTNDGDLAYRLTHPRYQIAKTYLASVQGSVTNQLVRVLENGVELEDGITQPADVRIINRTPQKTLIEITIREGRNRQVRRMCEKIGHPVLSLKRISFGTLELGNLSTGDYRYLTVPEVLALKKLCE
ncbi:MAG: pseudouridine synthase [Peptococcia bacterium]|jgi:pseudouridine synthase